MILRLPDSGAEVTPDGRRHAPSAARNAAPILQVLRAELPERGRLLEIASGTGQHAALFSAALPGWDWQPTDLDPANFASIRAWAAVSAGHVGAPLMLDAGRPGWNLGQFDAVLAVNLLHLISTAEAEAVLAGIAAALAPGGKGLIYGPFLREGRATSEGDAAFDASLRAQNPAIGYKDIGWVQARLAAHGMGLRLHEMPANNLMLVTFMI